MPGEAARGEPQGSAGPEERGLPRLAVLHPQVSLQGGDGADAEDGHRHSVHLQGPCLVGVGGVLSLVDGSLVGLLHMVLGPVRAEGAQQQPRHDALIRGAGRTTLPAQR